MRASLRKQSGQIDGRLLALFIVLGIIGAFVVPLLGQGKWWLPPLASEHGASTDKLFIATLTITAVVFVLVQFVLAFLVWRYPHREGRRAFYFPESTKMEVLWTVVPAVIMATLIVSGARLWANIHRKPLEIPFIVEVTGEQFKWAFRYPGKDGKFGKTDAKLISDANPLGVDPTDPVSKDDIVIPPGQGELHIPVHRSVEVRIRSKDVLHSFFLPHMRVKQDAVPGMTTHVWFVPTVTTVDRKEKVKQKTGREYSLRELERLVRAGVPYLASATYNNKSGESILEPEMPIFAEAIADLRQAGHQRIKAYQDFNFEIFCAELCGLGHYQMRGVAVVETEKELEEWMEQQVPFEQQVSFGG